MVGAQATGFSCIKSPNYRSLAGWLLAAPPCFVYSCIIISTPPPNTQATCSIDIRAAGLLLMTHVHFLFLQGTAGPDPTTVYVDMRALRHDRWPRCCCTLFMLVFYASSSATSMANIFSFYLFPPGFAWSREGRLTACHSWSLGRYGIMRRYTNQWLLCQQTVTVIWLGAILW